MTMLTRVRGTTRILVQSTEIKEVHSAKAKEVRSVQD